ncbi:MAG: hypothetical protein WCY97_07640 [Methanothrix sp.]|jgi:hypothetical protein|nr:hypothetical protein [Methanothrix harundinacea]MDD2637920.1 hypothetical protein [Methanothrix sp.]MDD3710568.1 hypothetical protein [Methanothrix sp.]MDD5768005.1 hypothetical protein [Methanothrix sp.]MDI9398706.1 hypothetical protein [Euryarchaeota archaeon]
MVVKHQGLKTLKIDGSKILANDARFAKVKIAPPLAMEFVTGTSGMKG